MRSVVFGPESLRRRFFSVRRNFTEQEVDYSLNIDSSLTSPGQAVIALAVIDQHQGQGVGAALVRHLTAIARVASLREFVADVLLENKGMLSVFAKSGLPMTTNLEDDVVRLTLRLI